MIDLKAVRDKIEALPIASSIETSLGRYSHGSELIVRLYSEDESVMVSYSMTTRGCNRVYTVNDCDDDVKNVYETNLTTEEVLERLKANLSERGIEYDNI